MSTLPMFPLGNVLFPHMVLPLHVFEPRYRALVDDVLAGDKRFGVPLITRGHEVGGGDERTDVGTVAQILRAEQLDDGRWLVVGLGTSRFRVTRWLPDDRYPIAEVEPLDDAPAAAGDDHDLTTARERLVGPLRRVLAMLSELGEDGVPATLELDDDPEVAGWQTAVLAPLNPLDAQRVLASTDLGDRLAMLDELLEGIEQLLGFQLATGGPTASADD